MPRNLYTSLNPNPGKIAPAPSDMPIIAHISDPHFGTERPVVVKALTDLLQSLKLDLAIISGDLTQRAREKQFLKMRTFMENIGPVPKLIIPGNHDIPLFDLFGRFLSPYRLYLKILASGLEPVFKQPDIMAIAVNTTRRYRHKQGEISHSQIMRVSNLLKQATERQLRLVITHQPVCVVKNEDAGNLLRGGQDAIRAWAEAGADLILGGHIHLPFIVPLEERITGVTRPVWAVQAGTAVSRRTRNGAGNSINLIHFQDRNSPCIVERWDYYQVERRFKKVTSLNLSLAP